MMTLVGRGQAYEVVSARLKFPYACQGQRASRLPSLRGFAQWTDVRKDKPLLIVPGREAGYAWYKRRWRKPI